MDDEKDNNNIINLLSRLEDPEAEYSEEWDDWETSVDLSLQDIIEHAQLLSEKVAKQDDLIEDLNRDIQDLKRTVQVLIRQLYTDRKNRLKGD